MVGSISEVTQGRDGPSQCPGDHASAESQVNGWAKYFMPACVSTAYCMLHKHVRRRLRRWLCKKHKVSREQTRFLMSTSNHHLGLVRLAPRTPDLPWAKA